MRLIGTTTKKLSASGNSRKQISVDCFNNTFTTDTGTPAKNIPSFDDFDNEGTVSTFHRLVYSSSYPRNSEIRMISDITVATSPTTYIGHTASKEVGLEGGGV